MFNFFEKIAEGIEFKLISDFSGKIYDWIKEINKNAENNSNENNIATSGDYSKVATSGNDSKVATSGYMSQVATSGDYSKVAIEGNNSVGFACGYKSIIKAKKGTWISLCEYGEDKEGYSIPFFATSAQIGNNEYKDFKGRILKETEYYCLYNKKFYPVDISDGIKKIKISEKKRDGITIIKAIDFYNTDEECYIVKEGELNAHGETLQQALEDLQYKKIKSEEVQAIVKEIKKTGKEYLNNVIKPFREKVTFIQKAGDSLKKEYIKIGIKNDTNINLPYFETDTMYKGMKKNKEYTLTELGLED